MNKKALKDFECLRCGDCCKWHGYVRITEEEADQIAEALGISLMDFLSEMTVLTADRRGLSISENPDGSCIFFLDNPPRCKIYNVRPEQCRTFPRKWKNVSGKFQCRNNSIS